MTPGLKPCLRNASTSAITTGVLPAPPTVRLPTIITGCALLKVRRQPAEKLARRAVITIQNIRDNGHSIQAKTPRRCHSRHRNCCKMGAFTVIKRMHILEPVYDLTAHPWYRVGRCSESSHISNMLRFLRSVLPCLTGARDRSSTGSYKWLIARMRKKPETALAGRPRIPPHPGTRLIGTPALLYQIWAWLAEPRAQSRSQVEGRLYQSALSNSCTGIHNSCPQIGGAKKRTRWFRARPLLFAQRRRMYIRNAA